MDDDDDGWDWNGDRDERARTLAIYALSALGFVLLGIVLGAIADWITHR